MSRDPRQVLIRPLMTEKSMRQKEELNTVAFQVRPDANKVEIRTAVESVFNVKVTAVRTASYEGKLKRMGRFQGRRSDWKKAIVTLAARPQDRSRRGGLRPWESAPSSPRRPARRYLTYVTYEEITKTEPEKRLLMPKRRTNGRNGARPHHRAASGRRGQADAPRRSTSAATSSGSRRGWPRSSTTRIARRAWRCSSTATARSATSSRPTASRSATP